MNVVGFLIQLGVKLVATITEAILAAGGTEDDVARFKVANNAEINRVLANQARVRSEVEAIVDKLPPAGDSDA